MSNPNRVRGGHPNGRGHPFTPTNQVSNASTHGGFAVVHPNGIGRDATNHNNGHTGSSGQLDVDTTVTYVRGSRGRGFGLGRGRGGFYLRGNDMVRGGPRGSMRGRGRGRAHMHTHV